MHHNIFIDPNIEKYIINRQKILGVSFMTTLIIPEPFINDYTDILRTRFDEFAKAAETINLPYWL